MSENIQINADKEGYVCPRCRLLFTLPKAMGGNGAQCPGCDNLLTIPSPEDGVLAQGVSKVTYQQAGLSSLEFKSNEATREGQWKGQRRSEVTRLEGEDKALRWMLPIGLVALVILGGLAYVLTSSSEPAPRDPIVVNNTFGFDKKKEKKNLRFDHQNSLQKIQLKEFLDQLFAANTIDELIKYCRQTEGLRAKMEGYYKEKKLTSKKLRTFVNSADFTRLSGFITFKAETSDYDILEGVLEYKDDKLLLDWESYVAYSEMSWAEMRRKKPTEPVTLRLVVKVGNYYNNQFKDETKWQSLVITNPNEESTVLHAYVKKKSAVEQQVTNFGLSGKGYAVTVKAHYPKNAQTDDQIIISQVVNDNWIQK